MRNRLLHKALRALTALCCVLSAGIAAAESTMWLGTATVGQGSTGILSLYVQSEYPISGFNVTLQLPTDVTITNVAFGDLINANFTIDSSNSGNGIANVLAYSTTHSFFAPDGGEALRIVLRAKSDAPTGIFKAQIVESRERDINGFQVLTPRGLSDVEGLVRIPNTAEDGVVAVQPSSGALFADPVFQAIVEEQVRSQLGLGQNASVGIAELQDPAFTSFVHIYDPEGSDPPVAAIDGIENATNLTIFQLSGHNVRDIRPLEPLLNLTRVLMPGNRIEDVATIASLTGLNTLNLNDNRIQDIDALSGLTGIKTLRLAGNEVSNITPLQAMSVLATLDISNNLLGNIDTIGLLPSIDVVTADDNFIESLDAFSAAFVPRVFSLVRNNIEDLSPLDENYGFFHQVVPGDEFFLDENPLNDDACITIGAWISGGISVSPDSNGCNDPKVVFANEELDILVFEALEAQLGTGAIGSDVDRSELAQLESLTLTNSTVGALDGLEYATSLKTLISANIGLTDITPILGLTQLEVLRLGSNDLDDADLVPLANFTNLRELRVNNMGITRIDFVRFMPQLQIFIAGLNNISDLSPVENLTALSSLRVNDNMIADITPVMNNPGLGVYDTLMLHNNPLNTKATCIDLPILDTKRFATLTPDLGDVTCLADPFEPDDVPVLARTLYLGESHVGRSLLDNDVDWVRFSFDTPTDFVLEAIASKLDDRPINFLIDIFADTPERPQLFQGLNQQPGTLPAGIYLARVREQTGQDVGDYAVYLAVDRFEDVDNDPSSAPVLSFGQPHKLHTIPEDDVDWFTLELTEPSNFIQMKTTTVYGGTMPELFGPNDPTDLVPATFPSDDETQFFNALRPGTYHVRVRDFPEDTIWNYDRPNGPPVTSSYSLRVDSQAIPDAFEPDDGPANATPLEFGPEPDGGGAIKQSHNFHDFGDTDWYEFVATDPNIDPAFEVTDLGTRAFPIIDVFAEDAQTLLASGTGTVILDIDEVGLGKFFVRIRNANPGIFGVDTAYGARATQGTQATAIMYGTVYNDQDGTPVEGASVRILSLTEPTLSFSPTDPSGAYAIQGVPVDIHSVEIRANGFVTTVEEANVSSILLEDSVFDWRILPANAPVPTAQVFANFLNDPGGRGTVDDPVNTIANATGQVEAGGEIVLLPGATGETLQIAKAMRIIASGPSSATIGSGPLPSTLPPILVAQDYDEPEDFDPTSTESNGDSHQTENSIPDANETLNDGSTDRSEADDAALVVTSLGSDADRVPAYTTHEGALPFLDVIDGHRASNDDSVLAVRLRSESDIDPATIWGPVPGYRADEVAIRWQESTPGDMRDLWVLFRPEESWFLEDVLNVAVAAETVSGDPVDSENFTFKIESAAQRNARLTTDLTPIARPPIDEGDTSEDELAVLEDESGVFSIHPDSVYAHPQRVWIPLPPGRSAESAVLYYYHPHGDDRGWYAAEEIEDWLVPGSSVTIEFDGVSYLGFLVRHAGVVQLGFED